MDDDDGEGIEEDGCVGWLRGGCMVSNEEK